MKLAALLLAAAAATTPQPWRLEDWTSTKVSTPHPKYGTVTTTTYTSPVLSLETGGAHFSLNPITKIPFPTGNYSLLEADWDIIDKSDPTRAIPLSEVYNHHWLIGTKTSADPLLACEGTSFFGAGAEMRGITSKYPEGYGVRKINAEGYCGGNIHFIRTEDLKLNWIGMNDPKGSHPAAVKNCIECGWAPHRAPECTKALDGNFACCLTGSRCPVNKPEDRSTKDYQLKYNVRWTRNLAAVKDVSVSVLDVSDGLVEWNIAPNENNTKAGQVCNDKLCNITHTWTVDHHSGFKDGVCPGKMMWSYGHQHIGAINTTMKINGKPHCTSNAVYGTDPSNKPGNELGYVVNFTRCVDEDHLGNSVRLEKGDKLTISSLYDVDLFSKRSIFPGGKHGGVMGLFFYYMVCDEGGYDTDYTCAQSSCVPVQQGSGQYKTLGECERGCK